MPFFKTLVLISAALSSNAPGTPNMLKPIEATSIELGSIHGSAFYVPEAGGFHVVATLDTGSDVPVRFGATLAEGQSATISVPGVGGTTPMDITFVRVADGLHVERMTAPFDAVTASTPKACFRNTALRFETAAISTPNACVRSATD